jgi:hypothetical protein
MQKRINFKLAVSLGLAGCLAGLPAVAAGSQEAHLLQEQVAAKVPANWQVHVSARGETLVVFLMPPYQEAFDLWYQPERLRKKMLGLCPEPSDAIWARLRPEQGVAIEPTVGGKSAEAMRLACPRTEKPPA